MGTKVAWSEPYTIPASQHIASKSLKVLDWLMNSNIHNLSPESWTVPLMLLVVMNNPIVCLLLLLFLSNLSVMKAAGFYHCTLTTFRVTAPQLCIQTDRTKWQTN